MILKKDFFFVRHGQTDHNRSSHKTDHEDISLNAIGKEQAKNLAPLVAGLPICTICCSPLRRAQETKELLLPNSVHLEINHLGECTSQIWKEMTALGSQVLISGSETTKCFLNRAKQGINEALSQEGPVLIVAHGGIHWAICCWMEILEYNWIIDNCQLTHFSINRAGAWQAKILQELRSS